MNYNSRIPHFAGKTFRSFRYREFNSVTKRTVLFWLIILLTGSFIPSYSQYTHVLPLENYDLDSFEGRAQLIVESVADYAVKNDVWVDEKYGAYPAIALFATGHIELGRHFAREQLTGSGAMFREFGNMILYMKYKDLYDQALRDMVKDDQLHHSALYSSTEAGNLPGATENHKLMYAAANYLGGLAWPGEYPDLWFNAGYNYLMNWFDKITRSGYWEEDSPTYFVHHIGPILSVLEFAPDSSEMKRKATMAFEWYMAGVAAEYLRGYWITPSARDYTPVNGFHLSEESIAALWLYFGDTGNRIPNPHPTAGHPAFIHWFCAVHMATSAYRLPTALVDIGKDRDEPYSYKEYFAKNPMKPAEYGFMNKHYGLTSMVDESGNPPPDMTRWKLQWVPEEADKEPSVFFMKHPMPDEDEGWKNWEGASPYEQVFQHERSLISLYNIPAGDAHPFIDGPMDSSVYKLIIQKGDWWFFHTGELMFGVYAKNGLNVTGEKRIAYDHYGKTALTGVIRSDGTKNILIVETGLRENYPGGTTREELNRFADEVLTKTLIETDLSGPDPAVTFRNLKGDWLYISYDGERKLNNIPVSFAHWPMLENPWMDQKRDGRYLTIRHGDLNIVYDFEKWQKYQTEENINLSLKISPPDSVLINPGKVIIEALPDRDTGIIERVDFYIDDQLAGTDTLTPFNFEWPDPEPGSHVLEARLTTSHNTYKFSDKKKMIISDGTPEVFLISPQTGKNFLINDTLRILAGAYDYDGIIDSLHFLANDSLIARIPKAPFEFLWPQPKAGAYSLKAVVWDDEQHSDTSGIINIRVFGYHEAVGEGDFKQGIIYDYFEGNWTELPGLQNHTAVETDTASNIDLGKRHRDFEFAFRFHGFLKIHEKGEYVFYTRSDLESKLYIDDRLLIHNTSGAGEKEPVLLNEGYHKIEARMCNKLTGQDFQLQFGRPGMEKQSIPDTLLFRSWGHAPEIELLNPDTETIYNKGDSIFFRFNASDQDDDDEKIVLYEGDVSLAEFHKFSYTTAVDFLSGGLHNLKAVIYDLEGMTSETEPFTVSINAAPAFEFASPSVNEPFYSGQSIPVVLSTSDNDFREAHFYLNEKLLKSLSHGPWTFEMDNLEPGTYYLKGIITDTLNLESTVKTQFTVINTPPVVSIIKPSEGTVFQPGETVELQAGLTDSDGDVYKVAFYEDNRQIGPNANFNNQTFLNNISSGEHTVTARAFDKYGSVSVSDPVSFLVAGNTTGFEKKITGQQINVYPNPLHNEILTIKLNNITGQQTGMQVMVHDVTGRTLYLNSLEGIPPEITIPAGILKEKGLYIIAVRWDKGVFTDKILVE